MKKLLLLGIAAAVLTVAVPGQAEQTLGGGTGLIGVPTAETLAPMSLEAAADFINLDDFSIPMRAEIGLMEGLEVGGLFQYYDGDNVENAFGANAKYRLPLDLVENLQVAVGGSYTNWDPADIIGLFGVATYTADLEGIAVVGSAGLDWRRVSNGDSESGIGILLGLEVGVMEGLSIVAEYDGENGDAQADGSAGIAARYMVMDGLTVQAGFKEFGDMELFVGVQYAIGLGQ